MRSTTSTKMCSGRSARARCARWLRTISATWKDVANLERVLKYVFGDDFRARDHQDHSSQRRRQNHRVAFPPEGGDVLATAGDEWIDLAHGTRGQFI